MTGEPLDDRTVMALHRLQRRFQDAITAMNASALMEKDHHRAVALHVQGAVNELAHAFDIDPPDWAQLQDDEFRRVSRASRNTGRASVDSPLDQEDTRKVDSDSVDRALRRVERRDRNHLWGSGDGW